MQTCCIYRPMYFCDSRRPSGRIRSVSSSGPAPAPAEEPPPPPQWWSSSSPPPVSRVSARAPGSTRRSQRHLGQVTGRCRRTSSDAAGGWCKHLVYGFVLSPTAAVSSSCLKYYYSTSLHCPICRQLCFDLVHRSQATVWAAMLRTQCIVGGVVFHHFHRVFLCQRYEWEIKTFWSF